ncbi:iron-siderophore ABC transporter substrate-binding protein [Streptomyces sp. SP18CS02]|uniref:iron-siderophore ABC transporter substrate-binding protein n=1 Tax=Streptomyces sp. SP18CS02 TaxID=3002531 RepID=UPI002E7984B9|nr:iron-siderophore ABC transporter substrate-binding protein [Streptomyces sp. SP18CS02]MEE1751653.1 iron-siderophore ABC transporter substrate-binding protein [Streptomyces sp. SP18CS02]
MRRLLLTAAVATTAALTLTACGTTEPAADDAKKKSAEPITLTDASGAKVTLDGPAKKVVGTEWNVVENLVSLGVEPVGVADVKGYKTWNTAVPLKNDPKDIGTRGEPSMDTIASLSPDLIVATSDLPPAAVKQLRKVAPVLELKAADAADPIGRMTQNLDLIARATGTTEQAGKLKKDFEAKIAEGRKALSDAGLANAKYAFADGYVVSNQVSIRPYTSGSLIGAVNEKIGLKNAWTVKGDASYGLAATDVEGLTKLGDVQFAYIGSDGDKASTPFNGVLAKDAVWTSLPFVKKGNVHRLPDGIWMFGGPGSMATYIDSVVQSLTK